MVLLVAGTGGAIAIGESGSHGGPTGGASTAQYKNGKGCGDKNHRHRRHNQCKAKKKPKKHSKAKHKTTKKPTNGSAKCTTRTVHGLTVLYCNS